MMYNVIRKGKDTRQTGKDIDMGRYNYKELETAALNNPTEENLAALGEWFELYGMDFWNGECWAIDGNHSLYPIYELVDEELEEWELRGYEIR